MMAGPLAALLSSSRPVLLDGAMGTELQRRGVDVRVPLWSARALIAHPEEVLRIHRDYIAAGAQIITTNTFRTTARTFGRAGLADRSAALTQQAVDLARQARLETSAPGVLLAGSMAPLEDCYSPDCVPDDVALLQEHATHAGRLADAGVDFLLLETLGTSREARAACTAALQTGLEVVVSFLCTGEGTLYSGESIAAAVRSIEPLGPTAFSLNCLSPRRLLPALRALQTATLLPIAVYANVGRPGDERAGIFETEVTPEEYSRFAADWISRGVAIIGGCCGTTPAYIEQLKDILHRKEE